MERKNDKREVKVTVKLGICPSCGAECVEGNDVDMMITCAFCGHTFIPKELTELTNEEYKEKVKNAIATRSRGGWFAIRSK